MLVIFPLLSFFSRSCISWIWRHCQKVCVCIQFTFFLIRRIDSIPTFHQVSSYGKEAQYSRLPKQSTWVLWIRERLTTRCPEASCAALATPWAELKRCWAPSEPYHHHLPVHLPFFIHKKMKKKTWMLYYFKKGYWHLWEKSIIFDTFGEILMVKRKKSFLF